MARSTAGSNGPLSEFSMPPVTLFKRQNVALVATSFVLGAMACYMLQLKAAVQPRLAPSAVATAAAMHLGALDGPAYRFHQAPCPPPTPRGTQRRNLVFAAVGDAWKPDMWSYSDTTSWDLIAVYFGSDPEWACPECKLALHMPDYMKWQMVWALMNEAQEQWRGIWKGIRQQYDYIMVADDDLIMDACTIDTVFETMLRRNLLVAQPSNCRGNDSDSPYWVHWQLPNAELHYVNVIEVTVPTLKMVYLDTKIRPLLRHTFSGWGLPFCFSAAAGFPPQRLAIVDSVCMIHPARADVGEKLSVSDRIRQGLLKEGSIYARFKELTPFDSPITEQHTVWKECGYTKAAALKGRTSYPAVGAIKGVVLAEQQRVVATGPLEEQGAGVDLRAAALQASADHLPAARQANSSGLQETVLLLAQLLLAAVVGAMAAVRWEKQRHVKLTVAVAGRPGGALPR